MLVGATIGRLISFCMGCSCYSCSSYGRPFIGANAEEKTPEFPFVALLVSGGHTQLISVTGIGEYTLLGESIDDAAGEALIKQQNCWD